MRLRVSRVAGLALGLMLFLPGPATSTEISGAEISAARKVFELKMQAVGGEAIWQRRLEEWKAFRARSAARNAARTTAPVTAAAATRHSINFNPNVRVNDPTGDVFSDAAQVGPSVAGSGGNAVAVWRDGNGLDVDSPNNQLIGYAWTTNGGLTWTDGGAMPLAPGSPNWLWEDNPSITVNPSTGEYWMIGFVYPNGDPSINGIGIARGTFTGSTFAWDPPRLVLSYLSTQALVDHPSLTVDPILDRLYLSYTRTTLTLPAHPQDVYFQSSNDGASWSFGTALSSGDIAQGSRVAVGPDGEVYVVWQALGAIDRDLYKIRKSIDGGGSFATAAVAAYEVTNFSTNAPGSNLGVSSSYPRIAVDHSESPNRGRVYLCWSECVNYHTLDLDSSVFSGNISEPEGSAAFGQNDNPTRAVPFVMGNRVRGSIGDVDNDVDGYRFNATFGQTFVFQVDSTVAAGLDMDFRIFCSDSTTRLAYSAPGKGKHPLLVWSAPADGIYYLRCAARPLTTDPGTYRYRIHTILHVNPGDDRARDTRDVFVVSSANGTTWSVAGPAGPVRVNDDLARFDDWCPEIAISNGGTPIVVCYDWRDADPNTCAGQSNLYLYTSQDAGVSWNDFGAVTDVTSDWTHASSNFVPNQGEDFGLATTAAGTLYAVWTDARDGNPNLYTLPLDITTATLASLASSHVEPGRVELDWLALDHANAPADLERRGDDGAWTRIDSGVVGDDGHLRFVDTSVEGGRRYAYRLAFVDGALTLYSSEAEIVVPSGLSLALGVPQPNPASGRVALTVTLPDGAPARLSLVDVAGRVVATRDVGSLGAGVHRVPFGEGRALAPGLYVARLEHAGRVLTARLTVLR